MDPAIRTDPDHVLAMNPDPNLYPFSGQTGRFLLKQTSKGSAGDMYEGGCGSDNRYGSGPCPSYESGS